VAMGRIVVFFHQLDTRHFNTLLIIVIIILFFFSLSVIKIPRAKNMKLKSKVGTARGPVLDRWKQSSRALRPD